MTARRPRYIPPFPSIPRDVGPFDAAAVDELAKGGPPLTIVCRACGGTLALVRGRLIGGEDAYAHVDVDGCPGRPAETAPR